MAALSFGACVGVLVLSDGSPVESWIVSPSVLLAIFVAIFNASLRYCLAEGINISWWVGALKGTSVGGLHRTWLHGTSLMGAATAGRNFDLTAAASIVVAILAINGPLLQRSSSTALASVTGSSMPVIVRLATQLPFGHTGFVSTAGFQNAASDRNASLPQPFLRERSQRTLQERRQGQPISASSLSVCDGICDGIVHAAGLYTECQESKEVRVLFSSVENSSASVAFAVNFRCSVASKRGFNEDLLAGSFSALTANDDFDPRSEDPYIRTDVVWSPKSIGPGNFSLVLANGSTSGTLSGLHIHTRSCKLYSGTSSYPVRVSNDTVALSDTPAGNLSARSALNTIALAGRVQRSRNSLQSLRRSIRESTSTNET